MAINLLNPPVIRQFITDPRMLPMAVAANFVLLKNGPTSAVNSDAAAFFTSGASHGASASIAAADTYVTVCNIAGSGFLANVVSPRNLATNVMTIKITVDGVAYEIAATGTAAGQRLVVGSWVNGYATSFSDYTPSAPANQADYGFVSGRAGGFDVAYPVTLATPAQLLSQNMSMLRFETSLKVEVKCSGYSATDPYPKALATYILDKGTAL